MRSTTQRATRTQGSVGSGGGEHNSKTFDMVPDTCWAPNVIFFTHYSLIPLFIHLLDAGVGGGGVRGGD